MEMAYWLLTLILIDIIVLLIIIIIDSMEEKIAMKNSPFEVTEKKMKKFC